MRGEHRDNLRVVGRGIGIIPACAGSTKADKAVSRKVGDHPRMRGEHLYAIFRSSFDAGSSPHARGALAAAAGE